MRWKADILQSLEELRKRFLMAKTKIIQRLIKHILRTILIDRIISQMHVHIIHIILIDLLILLRRKSHQPLIVDIDPQRVASGYEGIDPHVEFQALVKEGVVDVVLNHALAVALDFSGIYVQIPGRSWERKMPRPWLLAYGFTMNVFRWPLR